MNAFDVPLVQANYTKSFSKFHYPALSQSTQSSLCGNQSTSKPSKIVKFYNIQCQICKKIWSYCCTMLL